MDPNHNTITTLMNIFDMFQRRKYYGYGPKWPNINLFLTQTVLFLVVKLTFHRGLKNGLSDFIWSFYDVKCYQELLEKEPVTSLSLAFILIFHEF